MNKYELFSYWKLMSERVVDGNYILPFQCVLTNNRDNLGIVLVDIIIDQDKILLICEDKEVLLDKDNILWIKYGRDNNGKAIMHPNINKQD